MLECHVTFTQRRTLFINTILNVNPKFSVFDLKSLFYYIISLKDICIIEITSRKCIRVTMDNYCYKNKCIGLDFYL